MSASQAAVSAANSKVIASQATPANAPANGIHNHSDNNNGNGNGKKDIGAIIRAQLIPLRTKLNLAKETPLDEVLIQFIKTFNDLEKGNKAIEEFRVNQTKEQKAKEELAAALACAQKENTELRDFLEKANARNDESSEQYTALQAVLEETRTMLSETQKLGSGNGESAKGLTNDLQKTNEQILRLTSELESLQQKYNQKEKAFRDSQIELNANRQHFEEQLSTKQNMIASQKAENVHLETQLIKAKDAHIQLESNKNQKISELERQREEETTALRTEHSKTKDALLASHKQEKEALQNRLTSEHAAQIKQQTETHNSLVSSLTSEIDNHKTDVLAKKKAAENLNAELEQSRITIKLLQTKLTAAEQQQRKDKAELSSARLLATKSLNRNAEDLREQAKLTKEKEEIRKQLIDKLVEHQKQLLALTNSANALSVNAKAMSANNASAASAASSASPSGMMFSSASQVVSAAKILNGPNAANTAPASPPLAASVSSLSSQESNAADFVDASSDPKPNDSAAANSNSSAAAKAPNSKK